MRDAGGEAEAQILPGFEANAVVIEADNLPAVADRCVQIARQSGMVYQLGDVLVTFYSDADLEEQRKPYRIVPLDETSLALLLTRVAILYRRDHRTGELKRVNCPASVPRAILAERRYCFPQIRAVVETPLVIERRNGCPAILQDVGYHAEDEIYVFRRPHEFERLDSERAPTHSEALAALAELRSLLCGFEFEDRLSESVALAMLMTAVMRAALPAAPAFAVSARAPGTGKTLLQRVMAALTTGRDLAPLTWAGDEIELTKAVFSALLNGARLIVVDNVNGVLASDVLCVVLTASEFQARLLGRNEVVSVPTCALLAANGNNLVISGDLVRRTLRCVLDAKVERPELREFEFDPLAEALADRGRYVGAILTIVRGWLMGSPGVGDHDGCAAWQRVADLSPYGSFDAWSRVIRAPLIWLGMPDPVASIERAAAIDPAMQQLRAFLVVSRGLFGKRAFSVPDLVMATKGGSAQPGFQLTPDADDDRCSLREVIDLIAERNGEINKRVLGRWLAANEGRIEQGLRIVRAGGKGEHGVLWAVDQIDGDQRG